jgi:hypothetical protein
MILLLLAAIFSPANRRRMMQRHQVVDAGRV